MPDKLLFIDTETGGLDPARHSLLSLAMVVWEDTQILDSQEILIDDGILSVTAEVLAGHNVHFDAAFLRTFFALNNKDYSKFFSHRMIDTSSILHYLHLAGRLKQKATSSDQAFGLFDIQVEGRHTALGDAVATAELFTELLNLIRAE